MLDYTLGRSRTNSELAHIWNSRRTRFLAVRGRFGGGSVALRGASLRGAGASLAPRCRSPQEAGAICRRRGRSATGCTALRYGVTTSVPTECHHAMALRPRITIVHFVQAFLFLFFVAPFTSRHTDHHGSQTNRPPDRQSWRASTFQI